MRNSDSDEKDRLAKIFRREMVTLFTQQKQAYVANKRAGRKYTVSAEEYVPVLSKHLTRTANIFKKRLRFKVSKSYENWVAKSEDSILDLLGVALFDWVNVRARESASFIAETTNDQIKEVDGIASAEAGANRIGAAIMGGSLLQARFKRRAALIADIETQTAAETSKLITAQVISGRSPEGQSETADVPKKKADKVWTAISDSFTRDTHRIADGQLVDIDSPFTVGGYKLMSPSDTSLGAPPKEVMRCRCEALYLIDD